MYNFLISLIFCLIMVAICVFFGIRLSDFEKLIEKKIYKEKTLKQMTSKKESRVLTAIRRFTGMLKVIGNKEKITTTIIASILLATAGIVISVWFNNIFLAPVFAITLGFIPFFRIQTLYAEYKTQMLSELSTALPIINSSYERNTNIVDAISENINEINYPLKGLFEEFLMTIKYVNPDVKAALETLKSKVDNSTFVKWCEIMQDCVDDNTQMAALPSICSQLTTINSVVIKVSNILYGVRKNFYAMVICGIVLAAVALFSLPSAFMIPTDTPLMQILLAVNALTFVVMLIRAIYLTRQTKFDM